MVACALLTTSPVNASSAWHPARPDHVRSPHTGLTREHWKACGRHLVEQLFSSLPSMDAPLVFPKVPGKSYPRPDQPRERFQAAELEGFTRSLNLVAPLLQEEPELSVRGVRLLDYYRRELVAYTTPGGPRVVPLLSRCAMAERENWQMTCEFGGLSAVQLLYPRLWEALTKTEQDNVAAYLSDYAHGPTAAHNWRWFNVMMMLFLRQHGYAVDETIWESHLDALMALYAGEGWFRDAHFDCYNAWVFQLYAPIWCRFYGYEHAPELAALMERQSREFIETYLRMFARNGHMLMWGRSIAYRTGAVSPIPAAFLFRNPPPFDPGRARRLVSGNLLQFVTRDDFLMNGVPSLGFYGHFEPCIQGYSCAASPMWGYLNYLAAFALPADHPFWTAVESDGEWPGPTGEVRDTVLGAPGIQITNYGRSGHSEIRTAKAEPDDPNYNRLGYHTAFPWEALDPASGMAGHYTRRLNDPIEGEGFTMPVKMFWGGVRDGVLYRQLQTHHFINGHSPMIDLAGVSLPLGVLRVGRSLEFCLNVFDYCSRTETEVRRACCIEPRVLATAGAVTETELVGPAHTDCFEVRRLRAGGPTPISNGGRCCVLLVTAGTGVLRGGEFTRPLTVGAKLLLPAAGVACVLEPVAGIELETILCSPGACGRGPTQDHPGILEPTKTRQ